jgi:hypothetical protein
MQFEAGADIAIGSRQSLARQVMGRGFNVLLRILLGLDFKDTQCGFKAFRRGAAQALFPLQRVEGWGFAAELLFLARKRSLKVTGVPAVWAHDDGTRIRPLADGSKMLLEVLRIRWYAFAGKYGEMPARPSRRALAQDQRSRTSWHPPHPAPPLLSLGRLGLWPARRRSLPLLQLLLLLHVPLLQLLGLLLVHLLGLLLPRLVCILLRQPLVISFLLLLKLLPFLFLCLLELLLLLQVFLVRLRATCVWRCRAFHGWKIFGMIDRGGVAAALSPRLTCCSIGRRIVRGSGLPCRDGLAPSECARSGSGGDWWLTVICRGS